MAEKWTFAHKRPSTPGLPPVKAEVEKRVLQFAQDNPSWGYDRIAGDLANVGYRISDQTVGHILRRHGLSPAPERRRQTTWPEFVRQHPAVLWTTDFFTTEVWTATGLLTLYVLFFIQVQTRRVVLGGITANSNAHLERWHRFVQEECLSKLILFGETSLRHAVVEYLSHFQTERNHQGNGNVIDHWHPGP